MNVMVGYFGKLCITVVRRQPSVSYTSHLTHQKRSPRKNSCMSGVKSTLYK